MTRNVSREDIRILAKVITLKGREFSSSEGILEGRRGILIVGNRNLKWTGTTILVKDMVLVYYFCVTNKRRLLYKNILFAV